MKQVVTIEEAVGHPLAHDITEILPGEFKGVAFKKGYVVQDKDLDHLRRLGKNNLHVLKISENEMHEDEAALLLAAALSGPGVCYDTAVNEGKIGIRAARDGLLKVEVEALTEFNLSGEVMCATAHSNTLVQKGDTVAATRAIPLVVARKSVTAAVAATKKAENSILRVLPIRKANVAVLITGNEVYYGKIKDKFAPVIRRKVKELGSTVINVEFLPDDDDRICTAALQQIENGADLLITTGGMSVDADDRTRFAMAKAGFTDIVYGTPVLPGAMFMVAYLDDIPVLGVPACGMYAARTILDLIFPRVLAEEKITRKDLAQLGHGGLCLNCEVCRFPVCPFGK